MQSSTYARLFQNQVDFVVAVKRELYYIKKNLGESAVPLAAIKLQQVILDHKIYLKNEKYVTRLAKGCETWFYSFDSTLLYKEGD